MAMTADDKARLLGLFFWLYTAFNLLVIVGIALIYLAIFGFVFSQVEQKPGEPPPELILGIVVVVFAAVAVVTLLISIPKIIAGYGLRNGKPWARAWAIVASVMACMSFPLGTAIGVFGLMFLFSEEGKQYFDQRSGGALFGTSAPAPSSWR